MFIRKKEDERQETSDGRLASDSFKSITDSPDILLSTYSVHTERERIKDDPYVITAVSNNLQLNEANWLCTCGRQIFLLEGRGGSGEEEKRKGKKEKKNEGGREGRRREKKG